MSVSFVLEALVVLGCIVMGTRAGGVGVGLWGGLGTFVLVFVFGEAPGRAARRGGGDHPRRRHGGGADAGRRWHRLDGGGRGAGHREPPEADHPDRAADRVRCSPSAPGPSNIIYPLLPVIYDVSYRNHIRPSRPLTVTVVQSGIALAASPVSAAMAAMLTLTDVAPYNLGLTQILAITLPACVIGIVVTVARGQPDVEGPRRRPRGAGEDRLGRAARARRRVAAEAAVGSRGRRDSGDRPGRVGARRRTSSAALTYTKEGRNSALVFLARRRRDRDPRPVPRPAPVVRGRRRDACRST